MNPNPKSNPAAAATSDKEFLLSLLRESREKFLRSFAGLPEDQCRQRPAPESWCVLETVEHLTSAEGLMLKLVTTQRSPRTAGAPNREQVFLQVVADRGRKMQAPESGRPRGRFPSLAAAEAQFRATREGVIQFVEQSSEDLRATEVTHPHPSAGVVSTYEMVIVMAKHAERHAAQIDEIRGALGVHSAAAR
jgi:uncharacterized damage-inducible protein DinB